MKVRTIQDGFSAVELVIVVVVLAIVGLVGYRMASHDKTVGSQTTATVNTTKPNLSTTASDVSTAPTINSASDLNKAEAVLSQNDPGTANAGDSNQLNTQLNGTY